MKVSLRFLLLVVFLGMTVPVSFNGVQACLPAPANGDELNLDGLNLHSGNPSMGHEEEETTLDDYESSDGDYDQEETILINNTGEEFWVFMPNQNPALNNLLVPADGQVALTDDDLGNLYINTNIPSRRLGKASFDISGLLHIGATYTVELYDEVNGHALFDAHGNPVWNMRFSEEAPAPANGQVPHIFTKVRPK